MLEGVEKGSAGESAEHEADHGEVDEGLAGFDGVFVIFAESASAAEPREGALDDPAARQEFEVGQFGAMFDDLEPGAALRPQGANPGDERAGITAIGPDAAQPTEARGKHRQQQAGAIAVLHAGRMHFDQQD